MVKSKNLNKRKYDELCEQARHKQAYLVSRLRSGSSLKGNAFETLPYTKRLILKPKIVVLASFLQQILPTDL